MKTIYSAVFVMILMIFSSCGNKTIESHNDTIVLAHNEIIKIDESMSKGITQYFGKPEQKENLKKFLKEKRELLLKARKPIEDLADFEDSGMKKKCLKIFDEYESLILTMNLKADSLSSPSANFNVFDSFLEEFKKIDEAEMELREAQQNYASQNNVQLR